MPGGGEEADETDLAICRALLENSRAPYTELGRALGLTPQAVHRRVQELTEEGVVLGTVTRLTPRALGVMLVFVHGTSKSPFVNEAVTKLGAIENITVVFVGSGNYVYVYGTARDSSDLAAFVSAVQGAVHLDDVQVGIVRTPPPGPTDGLSPVDLRLVAALRHDSRKALSQVAAEAGITPKTARRRLDRLLREGLISFTIQWKPVELGDTIAQFHLTVKEGAEPEKVAFFLIKRLAANVVRTWAFSNLPDQIMVTLWTKNVRDMQRICLELETSGLFGSVLPRIIIDSYYFDEHQERALDEMLRDRAPPPAPGRRRSA